MKKKITILFIIFTISLGISVYTMPDLDSHGRWHDRSITDIRSLSAMIDLYRNDFNQLPSQNIGFESLVNNEKNIKYLKKLPIDRWGTKYIYKVSNNIFKIYSAGPDKIDNNGMKDDVILGNKSYDCETYHDCLTAKDYISNTFEVIALVSLFLLLLSFLYISIVFLFKNKERK